MGEGLFQTDSFVADYCNYAGLERRAIINEDSGKFEAGNRGAVDDFKADLVLSRELFKNRH